MYRVWVCVSLCVLSILVSRASAQNAAGVFGPVVREGLRDLDYRYSVDEPADDLASPWVQRLHYDYAFNGRAMGRIVGQWRDTGNDVEADFIRAELFVEAGKPTEAWTTGFRFDAMARNGDRPDQVGLHWTNEVQLNARTSVRFVSFNTWKFGDEAPDRVFLETRAAIRHRRDRYAIGFESYNPWGNIDNLNRFRENRHQVGPFVSAPVGPISVFISPLFGISESAPDVKLRTRFIKRF